MLQLANYDWFLISAFNIVPVEIIVGVMVFLIIVTVMIIIVLLCIGRHKTLQWCYNQHTLKATSVQQHHTRVEMTTSNTTIPLQQHNTPESIYDVLSAESFQVNDSQNQNTTDIQYAVIDKVYLIYYS